MRPKKDTQESDKSTTATGKTSKGFTDEERAAMKERSQELKAAAKNADGESAVLAKIAEMPEPERTMAERLHAIIKASAPALSPKTWYGQPAYTKDGKVVCFFQSAQKFNTRYATLRLQRRGEPRRRRHVADLLRAEGVDCRRRGEDRRAREESGELRTDLATSPRLGRFVGRDEAFPRNEKAHHVNPFHQVELTTRADHCLTRNLLQFQRPGQQGHKRTMIERRLARRMAVTQIDQLEDYVRYLGANPLEVETLFRDLLIGVTNFFRDPQAYAALAEQVIPGLCARSRDASVRIWVPACSTGEEAYSHAILLREYLDAAKLNCSIQVFATDIDAEAIERARAGVYPDSIIADVGPERLARYFAEEDGAYRVRNAIRETVVFANQDLLKDPPFSRLDLISCRNLLIYLDSDAQKKIVQVFHYALNDAGYLFLGNSETASAAPDLFDDVDKKWRIYRRRNLAASTTGAAPAWSALTPDVASGRARPAGDALPKGSVRDLAERVLLERITPPSVLINADCEVLYIHGHTGRFLEPAPGEVSVNLLRMAREGLRQELTVAVRRAIAQQTVVRYDGLHVKTNLAGVPGTEDTAVVNLIVQPVTAPDADPRLADGDFRGSDHDRAPSRRRTRPRSSSTPAVRRGCGRWSRSCALKEEYLQSAIEELQTGNEELRSTNEELQSANEELQSTNEEMNTTKEELQSVNEELATVNTELQGKIEEVGQANNDLSNLLASTGIGTLFVDHQLRVQRFTPATSRVVRLIQTDVGRPVSDIVARFRDYSRLSHDVKEVLDTLIPRETVVQHEDGPWYQLRIQPYRTAENVIEGAVLTFVEVTEQKLLQIALQESQEKLTLMFELLPVGVSVLDGEGQIVYVNPALETILGISRAGLLRGDHVRHPYLRPDGSPMPVEEVASAQALLEQRAVHHIETGVMKDDGTVIWTDMSAVPVALPGWKVVVVTFNLSESRRDSTPDSPVGPGPTTT